MGGSPFIDIDAPSKMHWRDGDIAVNGGVKCGTHWGMNIVYQLLSGGDDKFEDLYEKVPWVELRERPGQQAEERIKKWDMRQGRRAFKCHSPANSMPPLPQVKYLIICRNGKDVMNSLLPFCNNHSEAFRALWGAPPKFSNFDEVLDFAEELNIYHMFFNSWWPYRNYKNVLFVHFADLKKDLVGNIRKIAKFLEIPINESKFPKILECNTFKWMSEHEAQIQSISCVDVPFFDKMGVVMRQGEIGVYSPKFTAEHEARWEKLDEMQCPDPAQRAWMQKGGPLPC